MNPTMLERALKDSVQVKRDAQTEGAWVIALNEYRNPYVAPWGTRACERDLRRWSRDPDNWMAMGAFSNLIKKVVDTPWIVDGPRTGVNRARYFQDILRQADFGGNGGSGWEVWLGKGLLDLCRQNGGWYFEKIGPGDPLKPLTGAITGIAHLDSLRCYPTGDPEFPVIYYNYNNEKHILHYTRVGHIVDMPDGDEFNPGYGYSPLYRSMGIVYQQWLMMRYNRVKLDELPAPGFASIKGMSRQTFEDAVDKFVERRANDTPPAYGNLVTLFGLDAALPVELTLTTFSQAPEGFDYPTWLNVQANALALTIGVDKQDIWELATRGLGTGAQSEVLHEKSQAKMYGFLLATIERVLNDVLPESCEFQFKPTDTFASLATAQTATAWATYTQTLGTDFTPNEKRALQADQVPAAHDVLVDDRGQMVMLGDADVQPETDVSLTDATTIPGGDTATPAAAPTVGAGDSTALPAKKDFDATREQFVANLVDLIHGSVNDDVSRRRAGVVMRAQLNSAGKQARLDGLVDGGVTTGLSDADLNAHAVWLAQQSGYVTDFLGSVYKSGLSDAEIDQHAEMWANKSLQSAYFEGLNSADADGTYEFFGEDGKESCADCRRLKGTQMRMSEWTATKQRPGVDTENFDCGGWQCKHGLRRVSATSKAIKKKDYDPSEPRDDHGMWTDAGGGLGGESKPERERPAPSKEPLYRTDFDGVLKEEGLNAKWKLSVQDWAASDYKPITYAQQQLYDGKTFEELQPLAQRYAEKANLIETGMKELPTYDGEVWRTLKLNNLSELQGVQGGALEVGSTMQLKTLSSFSNEPGAYGGAIDRTVLHVKNNQSGVSIEALSMLHNEREVLVPSHTTYRVLGITNRADLPDRTPFGVNPEGIPKSEIGYVIDLEEITQ